MLSISDPVKSSQTFLFACSEDPTSTGLNLLFPVESFRKSFLFEVPTKMHCLLYVSEVLAYAGLKVSSCLDIKCFVDSTSAFRKPESSAISMIQAPCICSSASLPWTVIKVSENHFPPSFLTIVLFPVP